MGNTAFQCIIGIYQKDARIGEQICIGAEGCQLIGETHYPAMRMGTLYGNIIQLACQHVACCHTAADDCRSCTDCTCIGALCAAQTKFQNGVALCCVYYTGSLCCNQALVVDNVQQCGFNQLCLNDGGLDTHQRLMREYDGSFGNGINLARKAEASQVVNEVLREKI